MSITSMKSTGEDAIASYQGILCHNMHTSMGFWTGAALHTVCQTELSHCIDHSLSHRQQPVDTVRE